MSTISATEFQAAPTVAHDAVSLRWRREAQHSLFSEIREAHRQHALQVAALSTGILGVTVAASAAVVLALTA
ncbi:hypothetical protein [Curtobacterium sp. RRHDQ10]|uniref:hypothetical protein n=1 Tax=Curtobacterium phyllosphaerae TaxID=3413379 RepID=UPI003BF170CF